MLVAGAVERQQRVRGDLGLERRDGRAFPASCRRLHAVEHGAIHHSCNNMLSVQSKFDSEATSYQVRLYTQG